MSIPEWRMVGHPEPRDWPDTIRLLIPRHLLESDHSAPHVQVMQDSGLFPDLVEDMHEVGFDWDDFTEWFDVDDSVHLFVEHFRKCRDMSQACTWPLHLVVDFGWHELRIQHAPRDDQ